MDAAFDGGMKSSVVAACVAAAPTGRPPACSWPGGRPRAPAVPALLGVLAVGDVHGDAVHAHRLAGRVARDDAGAVSTSAPRRSAAQGRDFDMEADPPRATSVGHRTPLADRRDGSSPRCCSTVGSKCAGSTPKMRYGPSSHSHIAGRQVDQSHEPMSPADSAMRAALLALRAGARSDASSSAVRAATRASSSAVQLPRAGGSCGTGRLTPSTLPRTMSGLTGSDR